MFETHDYYEYDKNNEDNIAVLLQQLTNESNELLADSENDLVRFEHVKNTYRSNTVITPSQPSVITSAMSPPVSHDNPGHVSHVMSPPVSHENKGHVFITGPNHRGTIYNNVAPAPRPQQSVIVRNIQVNKIGFMGNKNDPSSLHIILGCKTCPSGKSTSKNLHQ